MVRNEFTRKVRCEKEASRGVGSEVEDCADLGTLVLYWEGQSLEPKINQDKRYFFPQCQKQSGL